MTSVEIENRCLESGILLSEIRDRLQNGEASEDLVNRLQSLWVGERPDQLLSPKLKQALARVLWEIEQAEAAGLTWMTDAADQLEHLARGRRMTQAYHVYDDS